MASNLTLFSTSPAYVNHSQYNTTSMNGSAPLNSTRSPNTTPGFPPMIFMMPPYADEYISFVADSRAPRTVVNIILLTVGVIGNLFVLLILFKRKRQGNLSIYEKVLVSLALCDLGSVLANCLFFNLYAIPNEFAIGSFLCLVVMPITDSFAYNSALTLLLISYLRRRAIITPMADKVTGKKLAIYLAFIWLFTLGTSIASSLPFLTVFDVPGYSRGVCRLYTPMKYELIIAYVHTFSILFFPVSLMWFFYWQIRGKMFASIKVLADGPNTRALQQRRIENNQAMKMIIGVSIFYTVTMPVFLVTVLVATHIDRKYYYRTWFNVMSEVAANLVMLNGVVNCFFYCVFMPSYRKIVLEMFSCILPVCRETSSRQPPNKADIPKAPKKTTVAVSNPSFAPEESQTISTQVESSVNLEAANT